VEYKVLKNRLSPRISAVARVIPAVMQVLQLLESAGLFAREECSQQL